MRNIGNIAIMNWSIKNIDVKGYAAFEGFKYDEKSHKPRS